MSYDVQIAADSIGPNGARLTTFALKYPRMIHSELMTHRQFSRNASSTRAIPTAKLIEWIEQDPAMPVYWGKNQKGMQATQELSREAIVRSELRWLAAMKNAIFWAEHLMDEGVHKQIAGRILEPFAHINVVVSATSFENFFALRCHKDAMPEIQVLAVRMARLYRDSVPAKLEAAQWHLPFATEAELDRLRELWVSGDGDPIAYNDYESDLLAACTARCARVSYKTFDGKEPSLGEDIALHDRLAASGHWSPFEHCAEAMVNGERHRSGNFVGWSQYRKLFETENVTKFDYDSLLKFTNDFIV